MLRRLDAIDATRLHQRRRWVVSGPNLSQFIRVDATQAELDKRGGKNFGPPNGNKMTFFIDDMSMPEVRSRRPVM